MIYLFSVFYLLLRYILLLQEEIEVLLRTMNTYDIRLWEYAQQLVKERIKLLTTTPITTTSIITEKVTCSSSYRKNVPLNLLLKDVGIFRPPGHKGPFQGYFKEMKVSPFQGYFKEMKVPFYGYFKEMKVSPFQGSFKRPKYSFRGLFYSQTQTYKAWHAK